MMFVTGFMFGSENKPGEKYLDSIYQTSFSEFQSGNDSIKVHLEKNIEPISLIGMNSSFSHFNPDYSLDIYILKNNKRFTYVLYSSHKQMSINFEKDQSLLEGLEESLRIFNEDQP